jgi:D-3-phosphoglycerate dehydrogenase
MPANTKRVFYVTYVAHPIFTQILGARPDVRLDKLENESTDATVAPILAAAHAFQIGAARDELAATYHVTKSFLARTPNLLIVSSNGAGYDTVDVKACTEAGVLVVNQSGGNRHSVAEHVLAMVLTLSKRIIETDRVMRREDGMNRNTYIGNEAQGKTIGIVGLGNVGSRVAELCRGLFAMPVLAYDPYLSAEEVARRGARKVELDTLMAEADFVSVNCPLTEETRGMIGAKQFARMKPTAFFINTARGFIHDEKALEELLKAKKIAGAGLDVWDKEPPPTSHPLLKYDNVLASPHTAGVTRAARANMGKIAAEQLLEALDGKAPPRLINPEAWPLYARRFEKILGHKPAPPPTKES